MLIWARFSQTSWKQIKFAREGGRQHAIPVFASIRGGGCTSQKTEVPLPLNKGNQKSVGGGLTAWGKWEGVVVLFPKHVR